MAHDVFISYASEDRPTADAACHALEARGIRCWIAPRDVPPGRPYPEALVDAIQGAKVMVLVFSSSANASKHVPKEVERAASLGLPILPIRIEEVHPTKSLLFFLGSVHWLDALTPPVEKALEHLADAVNVLIGGTGERKLPPPGPVPVPGPVPRLSRPILVGAGAVVLILGALIIWRLTSSGAPLPSPVSPLPGKAISQEPLLGHWKWYNGADVEMRQDGNFIARAPTDTFAGTWQRAPGDGRYALTWPAALDFVTMSLGVRLEGKNQYGVKLTADRISGDTTDLTGSWRWWNGATVVFSDDGSIVAGPFRGQWAEAPGRDEYILRWPEPIDQVTVSPDGKHLSGANQYGFSLTATRTGN